MIKLVKCIECVEYLRCLKGKELKEHYDTRKKLKRCIGCDQLKYYYNKKMKPFENNN